MKKVSCFIMLCTNRTEEECLEKGLFGDREWALDHLKTIKKGDIGFLLNMESDKLIGIFEAEGPAQINIDPSAWGGQFPAQVKVKLIGKQIQPIENASDKLRKFIELKEIKGRYKIPKYKTYGPNITEKILSLFDNIPDCLKKEDDEKIYTNPSPSGYTLDDVAGLKDVKDFVYKRIIAPFEDEKIASSLKLKIGGGMLLFGPPGTGKTLISKSIASSIQATFIDISPTVIVGYPGEAEKRLENIFRSLDKEPRAVVFLDEAEWILCKRDDQTSSVMQRITPVLLAQLSRIFEEKIKPIIVIAATNKPQKIDPAFLRPGRFDSIFYVGLPDKNTRKEIIKLKLRGRSNQLNDEEITYLADKLEGYSGADIEYIIEESAFKAFERRNDKKEVSITRKDIEEVIEKTSKSVSTEEIKKIEEWAQERGIPIN